MATTTARRTLRWRQLAAVGAAASATESRAGHRLGARLAALPRLVRAVRRGDYAGADMVKLSMMLGAVGYVVSPVDLMPEALLAFAGMADDALVIAWLAVTLVRVTDDFLDWEANRDAVPGEVIR
ncbi:MAG: YkvA family protein [Ornithinimicrobium sp.]|uniref:YkvA family protein n=1 Tax=Ornithinimicrobium sp. TaxID=1977084 RepID=UPI003D9BDE0B